MADRPLAERSDWDGFWSRDNAEQYGRISWSKRRIIRLLGPLTAPDMAVMDAGCGSGFFSRYFLDQGARVTSVDYAPAALDMARAACQDRARFLPADMLDRSFPDECGESYDLIFSDGLLEHFSPQEQDRLLNNFFRVLRPGGTIATFVPNRWSPWQLIRPFMMPGIKEKPFTGRGLTEAHVRNGLCVKQSGGVNVLPLGPSPEFLAPVFGMLVYVIAGKA
ncbi:MAG: class I SAM-dependent methyltransferase [Candidatus Omnitrophota bacterium]